MTRYNYKTISVKPHFRTYYTNNGTVQKWIKEHPRKIKSSMTLTQKANIKKTSLTGTMTKEIPQNLIEGVKKIAKDQDYEYSIDIDFERKEEVPQQMLITKGGKSETIKVGDFELFGHTHPHEPYPRPSNQDLRILQPLRPEFIVAGKTGKTILINIEDYNKWYIWKNGKNDISINTLSNMDSKWGRERLFKLTGVQVYPMMKNIKIEMVNDPHYEKKFPRIPAPYMKKWHSE